MRFSENWRDFEVLDCSGGKKLERWGGITLIRPDPQVIWATPKDKRLWGRADAEYFRSNKGGGSWDFYNSLPETWHINYGDMTFNVKTMGFKHTGLFPEQAVNWDFLRRLIKNSGRKNIKVLNLFAYTGAATVACLKEGAEVVHVDASKGMVQWAKENAALSGVGTGRVRYIVDDCFKFVLREIRRQNKYDIIILDPPSYGRGPGGEVWRLEEQLYGFIKSLSALLSHNAMGLVLNSYTTGLSGAVMKYILDDIVTKEKGGGVAADEIGLRVSSTGGILPCGATAIWTSNGNY
ncbi:MAG: class I SAM-dependent methyltransferase [Clostridiales bacterium]|nr:class I SAM-dependent methyltransferase [Clostridiales bacterium]